MARYFLGFCGVLDASELGGFARLGCHVICGGWVCGLACGVWDGTGVNLTCGHLAIGACVAASYG